MQPNQIIQFETPPPGWGTAPQDDATSTFKRSECNRSGDNPNALRGALGEITESLASGEQPEQPEAEQLAYRRRRIPPDYADNDLSRFPVEWAQVLAWRPGKRGLGLGLIGPTGRCKTRMIFELLMYLRDGGVFWRYLTSFALGRAIQNQWQDDESKRVLKAARQCKILFLDDIGKQKFTAAVEEEFFDVIEERKSWRRPIIFTSNLLGDELGSMLSENMAAPLMRRFGECCEIIVVK